MKILVGLFVFNFVVVWSFDYTIWYNYRNREFSGDIYKQIAKDRFGNFVVCPISLELILTLLYDGARGQTAAELDRTVYLPHYRSSVNPLIQTVLNDLNDQPGDVSLNVANKIYVTEDLKLSDDFANTAVNVFKSDIENIDFRTPEVTIHKVNKWVSDQTHNYIRDLLAEGDVDSTTKSILVNTLFFKAKWLKHFSERFWKSDFYINERQTVPVDMLDTTEDIMYHEDDELRAKFIELPYNGDDLSMVIVLPERKYGLSHLEDNIRKVLHTELHNTYSVRVTIPKFKIESTIKFVPILENVNSCIKFCLVTYNILILARNYYSFTPSANLDGIAGKNSGLYVNNVIQKSFIEVNENGTLAASASATNIVYLPHVPYPEREFIANHPFIYYIKSAVGILFIGRFAGHE